MTAVFAALRRWFTETPPVDAAISFSSRAICAARVEGRGAARTLRAIAVEPLAEGVFTPRLDHPGFREPEALREALRRALSRSSIRAGEPVAAVVPDALVRFRLFSGDEAHASAPDRDEQLRFRLRKLLPPEASEARIVAAWPSRGPSPDRGAVGIGGGAAVLDAYEQALRAFGLDCGSVEPALAPLLDALGRERPEGDALLVHHDAASVSIALTRDGWPVALRSFGADVASSGDEIAREIATTAVFWRERLSGRSLVGATIHAGDAEFEGMDAAVRAAFGGTTTRAAAPTGLLATGVPTAILRAAAPALALLARP